MSVLVLKMADYLVVVITNNISAIQEVARNVPIFGEFMYDNILYIIIILTSTVIYFFRYFIFKKIFFKQSANL